ncbi:uncharacterized protein HD556DRAFT_1409769 [Suillus plorans]|uniref:Uncharacterized protein n=1 Tax=Suillus plorans TaxID=116603 RepID=A0A9P7ADX4_9AGAM|nr:uncharacterized protein HD556DRAFT_1409769 [Suillus plorans]KAG1787366.1 hypothetical protein HD556DRAFT_1409769 [Suillus plorans]
MRNHHRPRERDLLSENRDQELSADDEEDPTNVIYTARRTRSNQDIHRHTNTRSVKDSRASGFRAVLNVGIGWRRPKSEQITTAPGQLGAGETETEADEPPRHLPTTRILPASNPLVPPSTLTTLLFDASRLLSVVPALLGALINAWCVWKPPGLYSGQFAPGSCSRINRGHDSWGRIALPDRADYFLAVLWALLTAHQCLQLTTGLLHRWRAYYPPLSTLIRLLALQAICWPATHFTLEILGGLGFNVDVAFSTLNILDSTLLRWTTIRPDVCWAVIGTTTCISRSIQIWVTSNLLPSDTGTRVSAVPDRLRPHVKLKGEETRKLAGRRWDWCVVAKVCMLPAGCLYFVMAWIGAWRREAWDC